LSLFISASTVFAERSIREGLISLFNWHRELKHHPHFRLPYVGSY
jgi:hypothetical protein